MARSQHCSDQNCRAGLELWVWLWVYLFDVMLRDEFPRTWSLDLLIRFGGEWNTSITKSQRSSAGIPSMRKPASREITSASVELCETEVCFLHIQLIGTNVWLPKMDKIPSDVDLEPSRTPAKSESWNNPNLHCCTVFPTWQYCLNSHVWWMYEIIRAKSLSHAFVHFATARAILFTDHKISGRPIRAKNRHYRTICEQPVDDSPTDSFFFFQLMVIHACCCNFVKNCPVVLFAISFHALLCMTFPCHKTMKISFRHQVSPWLSFLAISL